MTHPDGCRCARCNTGDSPALDELRGRADEWCELINTSKSLPVAVIRAIQRLHGQLVKRGYTTSVEAHAQALRLKTPKEGT